MIQTKSELYKKAYVELNEIFNELSQEEIEKLPEGFIENIRNEMSSEYKWEYDYSKSLLEQDIMVETKALIVEIYERYWAPESEKEKWEKYDRICMEYIENQKREEFNPDKIFENSSNRAVSKEESIIEHKESILIKILNWISSSIGSIFKK